MSCLALVFVSFLLIPFDNILVYSKSLPEHVGHFQLVFQCLLDNLFFLKRSESVFLQKPMLSIYAISLRKNKVFNRRMTRMWQCKMAISSQCETTAWVPQVDSVLPLFYKRICCHCFTSDWFVEDGRLSLDYGGATSIWWLEENIYIS